jgi:protein O-mannosyl-transferase
MPKKRKKKSVIHLPPSDTIHKHDPAATGTSSRPKAKPSIRITTLFAAVVIFVAGLLTYATGLGGAFIGDDSSQIVANVPVHSISNLVQFFKGGTFYTPGTSALLTGNFYRPLMTTTFALIYMLFGLNTFAFHIVQILLFATGSFFVFLVFRYFFSPALSLVLSLVFLVHPINSQNVFAIASMQEPLFFLFGMMAIWTLLRFQDKDDRYLVLTAACLFISILAKESGILFVIVALIYTFVTNKRRFKLLLVLSGIVFGVYMLMRIPAIGLVHTPRLAPIDSLGLWQRLLNDPSIILFYIVKFIFPLELAHGYYWAYSAISFGNFYIPLLLDTGVVVLGVLGGLRLRRQGSRYFVLYIFFAAWLTIGLLLHLQIIPLDFTASETWFIFPLVGLLGMIGASLDSTRWKINRSIGVTFVVLVLGLLAFRTGLRGLSWRDGYTLASQDVLVSKEDYTSEYTIAAHYQSQNEYAESKPHAKRSIAFFPSGNGYNYLGVALAAEGDMTSARNAFRAGLKLEGYAYLYENFSLTYVRDPHANIQEGAAFTRAALQRLPQDSKLWIDLAWLEKAGGDKEAAIHDINQAEKYGLVTSGEHDYIVND